MIIRRKKLKIRNNYYELNVSVYPNKQLALKLESKNQNQVLTISVPKINIGYGIAIINPEMANNGIIRILKKHRIIKNVISTIDYGQSLAPLVKVNMGKLREYDMYGVDNYKASYSQVEVEYER